MHTFALQAERGPAGCRPALPKEDRLRAAESYAEYVHVDLTDIPPSRRADIVLEQLRLKGQRQRHVFTGLMVVAVIVALLTIVSFVYSPIEEPGDGDPPPDTTAVCEQIPAIPAQEPTQRTGYVWVPTDFRLDTSGRLERVGGHWQRKRADGRNTYVRGHWDTSTGQCVWVQGDFVGS